MEKWYISTILKETLMKKDMKLVVFTSYKKWKSVIGEIKVEQIVLNCSFLEDVWYDVITLGE